MWALSNLFKLNSRFFFLISPRPRGCTHDFNKRVDSADTAKVSLFLSLSPHCFVGQLKVCKETMNRKVINRAMFHAQQPYQPIGGFVQQASSLPVEEGPRKL